MNNSNNILLIPMEETEEEIRLKNAISKLKKFDKDAVLHLEQLADLAERNKSLFTLGLTFLKRR
jgi:hypothetical protein